jgi:hypothetical protein
VAVAAKGLRFCANCGTEMQRPGALVCSAGCCEAAGGHVLVGHGHAMVPVTDEKQPGVKARSSACSKRFWCQSCSRWLDGPACETVTRAA